MQTQDGRESEGLVKAEFQAVMQYLIVPLIQKEVQRLVDTNAPTFSGKPIKDIVEEWREKLQGAYHCLTQQHWVCDCPSPKQVKEAMQNIQKREAEAKEAEDLAADAPATLAAAETALAEAQQHLASLSTQSAVCTTEFSQAVRGVWAADAAKSKAEEEAPKADAVANAAAEALAKAKMEMQELFSAWVPTFMPFFLSMDNCRSYSLYEGCSKDRLVHVMPLLQVPYPNLMTSTSVTCNVRSGSDLGLDDACADGCHPSPCS